LAGSVPLRLCHEQDGLHLYPQVLNHVLFDRTLRVVVVLEQRKGQSDDHVDLFTDLYAKTYLSTRDDRQ